MEDGQTDDEEVERGRQAEEEEQRGGRGVAGRSWRGGRLWCGNGGCEREVLAGLCGA
jgi:hypothetical protein